MRTRNGTQKHYLCYMRFAFYAPLQVLLFQQKEISLPLLGEEEPLLIDVDTVHHVEEFHWILRIMCFQCHSQLCHLVLLHKYRLQRVAMNSYSRINNPMLHHRLTTASFLWVRHLRNGMFLIPSQTKSHG